MVFTNTFIFQIKNKHLEFYIGNVNTFYFKNSNKSIISHSSNKESYALTILYIIYNTIIKKYNICSFKELKIMITNKKNIININTLYYIKKFDIIDNFCLKLNKIIDTYINYNNYIKIKDKFYFSKNKNNQLYKISIFENYFYCNCEDFESSKICEHIKQLYVILFSKTISCFDDIKKLYIDNLNRIIFFDGFILNNYIIVNNINNELMCNCNNLYCNHIKQYKKLIN